MKASITPAERLRIGELIADARHLLAGVEDIEWRIALWLGGVDLGTPDYDAITDACGGVVDADGLLARLNIRVEPAS